MYEQYFGLKEKPFNITPDPVYFYPSHRHKEALDSLVYAINDRRGFVIITGEIGAGKTITCRTLLTKLERGTKVAVITNTHLTNKQLIMNVLEEFEVQYEKGDKFNLLKQLNDYLIEQHSLDNNVVLIIDEAQNLSRTTLEEVRMLSNLETEKAKLIQIVLMGQPELKDKLRLKSLAQLRQRVSIHYHIGPLSIEDTAEYIRFRLAQANANGIAKDDLFSLDSISLLYQYSEGIPRLINIICDNALLTAYAHDCRTVTPDIIQDAVKDNNIFEKKEDITIESPWQ